MIYPQNVQGDMLVYFAYNDICCVDIPWFDYMAMDALILIENWNYYTSSIALDEQRIKIIFQYFSLNKC